MNTKIFLGLMMMTFTLSGAAVVVYAFPTIDFDRDFSKPVDKGGDAFVNADPVFDGLFSGIDLSKPDKIPQFTLPFDYPFSEQAEGNGANANKDFVFEVTLPFDFDKIGFIDPKENTLSYFTRAGNLVTKHYESEVKASDDGNKIIHRFKLRDLSVEELKNLIKKYEEEAKKIEEALQRKKNNRRSV